LGSGVVIQRTPVIGSHTVTTKKAFSPPDNTAPRRANTMLVSKDPRGLYAFGQTVDTDD